MFRQISPDYARSHGDPMASSSRIRAKVAGAFAEFLLSALAVFLVPASLISCSLSISRWHGGWEILRSSYALLA